MAKVLDGIFIAPVTCATTHDFDFSIVSWRLVNKHFLPSGKH
jgi:hypothetical protein